MSYSIKDKLKLIKLNIINSFQVNTAYFSENWFGLGSTLFYTISTYLMIKIIYSNVNQIAGYSENEMIFLLFTVQLNYYLDWTWSTNNIQKMMESVYSGELDLMLSKPIPVLFFITFRDLNIVGRIKDGLPNLILLASLISWGSLNLDLYKVFFGVIILICGQISWHCFTFLFALPVFRLGKNKQIYDTSVALGNNNNIPFEGFNDTLKLIFTIIIPALITPQILVSVLLGKSEPISLTFLCLSIALIFIIIKERSWKWALENYTSASS